MKTEEVTKVLERAREVYGNKNQILVSIEELNELACVLAKFPRYDNERQAVFELYDRVLDEFADVLIILDHVQSIFCFKDKEVLNRVLKKVERVERWLDNSNSMQRTLEDRAVGDKSCKNCDNAGYESCTSCSAAQGCEGEKPLFKNKNNM